MGARLLLLLLLIARSALGQAAAPGSGASGDAAATPESSSPVLESSPSRPATDRAETDHRVQHERPVSSPADDPFARASDSPQVESPNQTDANRQSVNIGVLAHRGEDFANARWGPLGDYLTDRIPGYGFNILPLDWDQMRAAVISARVDFMLGNPGMYVEYEFLYNVRSLATLKNLRLGRPYTKFGSILFRRADRTDIQSVQDLVGKRFAAVSESAWGGWQVGWRQMLELGFDPRRELAALVFAKTHENVILAVESGEVDAGTVRTDALEGLAAQGRVRLEDFALLYRNTAYGEQFPFLLSSRLYPEWAFAATAHVEARLAEQVTVALLQMPADHPAAVRGKYAGWTVPENYQPVHDTFKLLGIPPYEDYQAISLDSILQRYGAALVIFGIVALLLVLGLMGYAYFLGRNALVRMDDDEEQVTQEPFWLSSSTPWRKVVLRSLPMVLVTAFSLLLLIYVSYGESRRVYEKFQLDRLASQSESLKLLIEDFVGQGLPFSFITPFLEENLALGKFAGFGALTSAAVDSQDTQVGQSGNQITLLDDQGEPVYTNAREGFFAPPSGAPLSGMRYPVYREGDRYRMQLEIQDTSGEQAITLGQLWVSNGTDQITGRVDAIFRPVISDGLLLIVGFTLLVLLLEARIGQGRDRLQKYLFILVFGLMAGVVLQKLLLIYEEGAEVRTKASAVALSERLRAISEAGTDFTEVQGLGQLFAEYQKKDPEIGVLSLLINNNVLIHPNPKMVGFAWKSDPLDYEQRIPLDADGRAALVVVMPWQVVRDKILRSIKNFSSLFISCAFIVFIFLSAARSFRDLERRQQQLIDRRAQLQQHSRVWLNIILVAWFLAIFAEGMNASFLPQFLTQAATGSQISAAWATVLFSAFFAAYVAVLVPAGKYAQTREVKHLLITGTGCVALGLVMMSLTSNVYLLLAARVIGGAGQGMVFIGVQSFVFAITTASNKSQGSSRMILGHNAGVISGAAIGALLVVYSSSTDIFLLGALMAGIAGVFVIFFIPPVGTQAMGVQTPPPASSNGQAAPRTSLWALLRDGEFLRTALLIGTPGKMLYNGVVFYAVPILMARLDYAQEDIGQALMIYAISTMVTNSFVPRLADRGGNSAFILLVGAVTLGFGAILLGISDWAGHYAEVIPYINQIALFGGLTILGLGNGFVAAPAVGHVAQSPSVVRLGQSYGISVFRVLERSGNILGPLLVGYLLMMSNNNTLVLAGIGVAMVLCGVIFFLASSLRPARGRL